MSDAVEVVACTADDILSLYYCEGCFERFRASEQLQSHEATCVAMRDAIVQRALDAQMKDDGKCPGCEEPDYGPTVHDRHVAGCGA